VATPFAGRQGPRWSPSSRACCCRPIRSPAICRPSTTKGSPRARRTGRRRARRT